MLNRKEQYSVLENVRCKEGETKRVDCPFCGGRYTLTISRKEGSLIWNCYKASCSAKGGKRVGYSLEAIKGKSSLKATTVPTANRIRTPLPTMNADPSNHEAVMEYLDDNNCIKAYEDNAIKLTYDPAKNRVLFWMNQGQGAVGRTLSSGVKPKWLSYGDTTGVLAVGNQPTAVVVEDAASACSVYTTGIYTGVALLGTNVSPQQKRQLMAYERIIICLDKDATIKALRLRERLSGLVSTGVKFLDDDLKYLSPNEIKERIDEGESYSDY